MKKVRFPHFLGMKKIIFVFLVTLEKEDKAMIAVIAIFGIFLLIGTIADTILNIMHLDIVPDSLLKVKKYIFVCEAGLEVLMLSVRSSVVILKIVTE